MFCFVLYGAVVARILHGAVGARILHGKCECLVMQMYVCTFVHPVAVLNLRSA